MVEKSIWRQKSDRATLGTKSGWATARPA